MRFLRQVLFGEHSIPFKQGARERCIAERKEDWEKRRKPEIERFREQDRSQKMVPVVNNKFCGIQPTFH